MSERIENLLRFVEEPRRTECLEFIKTYKPLFNTSKGSAVKHQAWPGGYRDHITEVMHIAMVTYHALVTIRPLPFSLSDALFCCFLHDVEKIWKHTIREEDKEHIDKDEILERCFSLHDEHRNAIKYAHGEGDDYHPTDRIQGPLAAFVHHCDNTSARIWFDEPGPAHRSLPPSCDALLLMEVYNVSMRDIETMSERLRADLVIWTRTRIKKEGK